MRAPPALTWMASRCHPAILIVVAAVYWRALGAGFVGDDHMILYRLRPVADLGDAVRFFRGEFFEYYRPLGFLSHAVDWLIAGPNARQFHLTNLLLHLANTVLVALIVRALTSGWVASALAALLFGLHASNHEAVVWISARFDLLATFFALLALLLLVRGSRGSWAFFLLALLSKEAAVALPIAAAAWAVFRLRATTRDAVLRTLPWLGALVAYSVLRTLAGGVPAAGGRVAKLVVFAAALAAVVALADSRWVRLRDWLRARRAAVLSALLLAAGLLAAAAWTLDGRVAALSREKLAVAGFAVFYLLSPVVDVTLTPHFLDPGTNVYWSGGVAALLAVIALLFVVWPTLLQSDEALFAAALLVATLLPISALTEGKRYLYLPSAAFAIGAAVVIARAADAKRGALQMLVVALSVGSSWQIGRKTGDWQWAGRMTTEGAALVDASLAPRCGGTVVFLTAPVAVRGVYTHFYYETFELPRGCRPDVFHVLARVVRLDTHVDVRRDGPSRIVITVPEYEGNFVLSRDLRHFDVPLRATREVSIPTPLGELRSEADGRRQTLTLTLDPAVPAADIRFFYFSDGRIAPLGR